MCHPCAEIGRSRGHRAQSKADRRTRRFFRRGNLGRGGSNGLCGADDRAGDTVQLNDKSKMKPRAIEAQKDPNNLKVPDYLEAADAVVKMKMLPERDAVPVDLDPQLIVEYYSGK